MLWPSGFEGLLVDRKTALGCACVEEGNKVYLSMLLFYPDN